MLVVIIVGMFIYFFIVYKFMVLVSFEDLVDIFKLVMVDIVF